MDRFTRRSGARRRCRFLAPAVLCLSMSLLAAAPATVLAEAESDDAALRHWGFGWDPGESGQGLTLRYRATPALDLSVAGGPDDYRSDSESFRWDNDDDVIDDGNLLRDDYRREQGWVRLSGGCRFWSQERLAVSAVCGVTYRWSHEEESYRDFREYSDQVWDYTNMRELHDIGTWTYTLGVRPSWEVTTRLQVEFEAGIRFQRAIRETVRETWWDSFPDTTRDETTRHTREFGSYGGFEFTRLKFIFWF
jgi:hypothetical protein